MAFESINLDCGEMQSFPLIEPYCLTSDFLGLTEVEILAEIAGRWEDAYDSVTNCEECTNPGQCAPDAQFHYASYTIVYVGPPATFKLCFSDGKVIAHCTPCDI
jgi:hypothetical protein